MNYEIIKKWLVEKKKDLAIGFGGVLLFLLGFGTHSALFKERMELKYRPNINQYTTPESKGANTQTAVKPVSTADPSCNIKGNINSKGKKIYHMPDGKFYQQTKAEECFSTESEAKNAGYVKSSM